MHLEAANLAFRYSEQKYLFAGVGFELSDGESLAVVGPSGVGKSTLLSIVAGYLEPTRGVVAVSGRPAMPGGIEYVIQSSPLLTRRTAHDNARLGRLIRDGSSAELDATTSLTLSRLGLGSQAEWPVHRLSGGERQRLGIARAVINRPWLLLADEPTASLDVEARDAVLGLLVELADEGTILIVATHDETVAARCDRRLSLRVPESNE